METYRLPLVVLRGYFAAKNKERIVFLYKIFETSRQEKKHIKNYFSGKKVKQDVELECNNKIII